MDKFIIGVVAFFVIFIGFTVYVTGLPSKSVDLYEESRIVCKSWSERWGIGSHQYHKCFEIKEVGNDY